MYYNKVYVAIIAFSIFYSAADAKKTKKAKRPSYENEESTPQPKVISYSTFGFNDVGSYDGFVPSSSDYAHYINGENQESTTRLYAPAFPTALEAIGYGNDNYETQSVNGQVYNLDQDNGQESGVSQYPQNIQQFFNAPSQENVNILSTNQEPSGKNEDNTNYPVYGAKLNYKDKNKLNQFNDTGIDTLYNSGYLSSSDDKYFNLPGIQTSHDARPKYGESDFKFENVPTNVITYSPSGIENSVKPVTESTQNLFHYPRVIDFTKMMQIHYPSATENFVATTFSSIPNENLYSNYYTEHSNNKLPKQFSPSDNTYDSDRNEGLSKKNVHKLNAYDGQGFSYGYSTSHDKNVSTDVKPNPEYKNKSRKKHWIQNKNRTNHFKNWRDASSLKGYDFYNDYNKSFNIGHEANKEQLKNNFDEVVPDSSNFIDFAKHQFNDDDYTNFKKMPEFPYDNNYNSAISTKPRLNDYLKPYKHLTDATSTATSYWGNVFKPNDYSSFPALSNKLPYDGDENDEDVVSITKRPSKYSVNRPAEIKPSDWAYVNHRPYKSSQASKDWSNELLTRYKTEEDLLSLRNHDTSHPTYLPIQKPYHNSVSDNEYKNIIEKWKQSYLKAKYKNSLLRDYEAIGTETEPLHVPIPKPYPIEIPHPVIVPVPRPYPVRIAIAKPVAVPVLRELTVPIEKPVPYPVYKKVPYPIEKPVPVTVEKEVAVPVVKPYPVHVPYIRPVFHHTKSMYDESDNAEDDDYMPRPENSKKNVHYKRRPYSSHSRTRRPNRGGYQDRNSRYPQNRRRPSVSAVDNRYKRPYGEDIHGIPYKYQERDNERPKDDHNAFILYCKRRGTC